MTGWIPCPGGGPHWGERGAAGLLPVASAGGRLLVLLCLRAACTDAGGTWGTPGGAIEPGETPWAAAVREAAEEICLPAFGRLGDGHAARCPRCPWTYTTFAVRVAVPAPVAVRSEVTLTRWFAAEQVPALRLHPGLALEWPRLLAGAREDAGVS